MKQIKLFFQILSMFVLLAAAMPAHSQGEWKWANYWSGTGAVNQFYNRVIKTAFDDEGNIYVFGTIGGQPMLNGTPLMFIDNTQVCYSNKQSILLTKFDTLGNLLWYKVVKMNHMDAYSNWMEVKDDKVYISGNLSLSDVDYTPGTWLYYLDTLITASQVRPIPADQRRPPYKTGRYTFFATLDSDGNLLEDHFVAAFSRMIHPGGVRGEEYLCEPGLGFRPFHIDRNGNTFVYTKLTYDGLETDPYTLVIDGDTNKRYDIYLPGSTPPNTTVNFNTGMMYKFSPDWELVYAKSMVDHTEGIATSWELQQDSVNAHYRLYIQGMSVDEDDNMYVSGYMSLGMSGNDGGNLHQYPVRIYWDSTHCATIQDISSSIIFSYLIKYDTDGIVQWCNQTYTRGDQYQAAMASWTGVYQYDESIFLTGHGGYDVEQNGLVYFDNESNPLQQYQDNRSIVTFFVRYNAQTGHYISHGIVPAGNAMCGLLPTVVNNRVFAYADIISFSESKIFQWKNDGTFINSMDVLTSGDSKHPSILSNNHDKLLFSNGATSSVTFGNNVSANCPSGRASAVFALYQNPELAEPYVGISDYEKEISLLKIWPNPTNSFLYIESDNLPIDYIAIIDLTGKTLMRESVGDNSTFINLFQLPAGIYLLEAVCKGQIFTEKFVKSNF